MFADALMYGRAWSMPPHPTFSERIKTRRRIWWADPPPKGASRVRRYTPHRLRDFYALRSHDDPERTWRCCAVWQRKVMNKWNGREFAQRYGCRVPALYWCLRWPSERQLNALPSRFVIRLLWAARRQGVFAVADGCDQLLEQPFSAALLRRSICRTPMLARTLPVIAEEFIESEDPRYPLPVEYKCHTFSDTVAAVQVIERETTRKARALYYTPDWQPFADPMYTRMRRAEPREPPHCLDEMLRLAMRLGVALGTYMRIDFFTTPQGCVFNEFSSNPGEGRNFTPFCNDLFGGYWDEKFPGAV